VSGTGSILELWRYPVKSMRGERVDGLRVDWRGAAGDRTHALYFEHKAALKQLTAREAAGLLRWSATYGAQADPEPDAPPMATLTAPDGRDFTWEAPGLAAALGADLGREVILRRDLEGQQDLGRSLLVTTEVSRRALEAEIGEPVDLRRFRTNLHLDLDAAPWEELDAWEGGVLELEGGVVLRLLHPCVRCAIPTRDPDSVAKWPGLLKHLNAQHATGFGINARVEVPGRIAAGEGLRLVAG
jgi:uncharacterized protein